MRIRSRGMAGMVQGAGGPLGSAWPPQPRFVCREVMGGWMGRFGGEGEEASWRKCL